MDQKLEDLLYDILEYLEGKEDVNDGDDGRPVANTEMKLATRIREALGMIV